MYRNFLLSDLVLFSLLFLLNHSLFAQGSWVSKAPVPTERMGLSSSVINDSIYVLGGMPTGTDWGDPASPILEVYDPVSDTWDTTKAPMQIGRNSFSCNTVNGKIYVFGGQSHAGTINISSVEEYDPLTDNWTFKAPMPDVRAGLTSCVVNDTIYVIGGWKYSSPGPFYHFREVWKYIPQNDTWDTTNALMPTGREYLTCSVVDGKIYVFGGWDESMSFSVAEMYDPNADNWIVVTNMPEERVYLNSASVNNLIYILGGSPLYNVPPRTETWEYNPVSDRFRTVTPMPMGIMQGTASEVNGKIYTFSGTSLPISFPVVADSNVFEFTPPQPNGVINTSWGDDNPLQFKLYKNYPNPFNPSTTIEFSIPKSSFVTLTIYNLLGQEVNTLVSDNLNAGDYEYSWNAGSLASGIYIYTIQARDPSAGSGHTFQQVRKMIYLK